MTDAHRSRTITTSRAPAHAAVRAAPAAASTSRGAHSPGPERCVLPDGFKAGLDPAHDKARFHVTERGITLITPSMLGQTPAVQAR